MYVCVNETSYVFCFDAQANEIKDKDSESSLLDDANRSQQKRRVLSCAHADTHIRTHTLSLPPRFSLMQTTRACFLSAQTISLSLSFSLSPSPSPSPVSTRAFSLSLSKTHACPPMYVYTSMCVYINVCTYTHTHTFEHMHTDSCTYTHAYTFEYMHVHEYISHNLLQKT